MRLHSRNIYECYTYVIAFNIGNLIEWNYITLDQKACLWHSVAYYS